jgi:uncharacterized Tic20 family protein
MSTEGDSTRPTEQTQQWSRGTGAADAPAGLGGPTRPYPSPAAGITDAVDQEDRNWAMAAHLSAVVGAWLALGFIGPLAVLLIRGDRSPFVRAHCVEALNFNLSVLIYVLVGWVLTFVLVGFPILLALSILWVVCTVLGLVKANRGELYRYPLTIRFVS